MSIFIYTKITVNNFKYDITSNLYAGIMTDTSLGTVTG
jgi:hypothetical protein